MKVFKTANKTFILKYEFLNYLSFNFHMAIVEYSYVIYGCLITTLIGV